MMVRAEACEKLDPLLGKRHCLEQGAHFGWPDQARQRSVEVTRLPIVCFLTQDIGPFADAEALQEGALVQRSQGS